MEKIFVTGATGLIGSALVSRLVDEGFFVHALVRDPQKANTLAHPQVRLFTGDLDRRESIDVAIAGCSKAFHLAAFARAWSPDPEIFDRINFLGGLSVLHAARQAGVARVVVTSTGGVMGASPPGRVLDESAQGDPAHMTAYERSKARLEAYIRSNIGEGPEVVIVNPTRVFGPGALGDSNGEVVVMQRYIRGKFRFLPGDGSSTGSYVHVDDVVNGHLLAMQKGRPGERYILGGENASFRQFFDTIGRVSGRTYRMYGVPLPMLLAFSHAQIRMARMFGATPMITPELVRKYTRYWDFSSEKAIRELGYSYRPLEQSVGETLAWLGGR